MRGIEYWMDCLVKQIKQLQKGHRRKNKHIKRLKYRSSWKPMTTAPRTNQTVVCLKHFNGSLVVSGWWDEKMGDWACFDDEMSFEDGMFVGWRHIDI